VTLRERFGSGEPVITSELVPPRGADAVAVRAQVAALAFADALNITDLPQARTRMSALAAAALVLQAGGRPILQMTTRDRNRLALAADAIGAAALGIEAILPLYGDPVPEGVEAMEVRDVDSPGLVALLAELAHGRTPEGLDLDVPASFLVGSAATPGKTSLENLRGKIDAGASFVQTQMVLDADAFAAWLEPIREAGLCERAAILPGLVIPRSAALIERLAGFGALVERLAGFGALVADGVAARAEQGEGLTVACELAEQLLAIPGVAGLHLMPLGAAPESMTELAAHARSTFVSS
jgi:methylenetetrahydrofolate reductase (NADPH)